MHTITYAPRWRNEKALDWRGALIEGQRTNKPYALSIGTRMVTETFLTVNTVQTGYTQNYAIR
jgi:hypothetical protein